MARDEGWFEEDLDLLGKMSSLLDDTSYQWLRTQPLEIRRTFAWPTFKAKWRRRFGLSRDMAMSKLSLRRQEENEDARSYGESVRQLCLSADLDCNDFPNCTRLVVGFRDPIKRQLKLESHGLTSGKSFEDTLERAVEIEKILIEHYHSDTGYRPLDVSKKIVGMSQDSTSKKGGLPGGNNTTSNQPGEHLFAATANHQSGGKGFGGQWTGGGKPNGGWHHNQDSNQQASSSGPTGAQGAVPMDIGAVSQQPHGRVSTVSTGSSFPELPKRQSGYPPQKASQLAAQQPTQVAKEIPKGGQRDTNRPFQRAAAVTMPIAASSPAASPSQYSEPSKANPFAGSAKGLAPSAKMANANYAQVGVGEMAAEYNLVQCRVIHADKSYDCTLDSGSCLNLIQWRTVKEIGLASSLVNTSIPFKVTDGHTAHTMGELPNVELSFGDCSFKVTFSVVDRMDQTILLGTSFMHQAGLVMKFHTKEPQIQILDDKGHCSTIPVTYHRSHQWIRDMESDRRNWPSEAQSEREGAYVPRVSKTLPHVARSPHRKIQLAVLESARISVPRMACTQPSEPKVLTHGDSRPQLQNLESENFEAPLEARMTAAANALTAQSWEAGYVDHSDYSLIKQPASANVHPILWDAYLEELCIQSCGVKYYPTAFFQQELAELMLAAIHPLMDLNSPDIPGHWGANKKGNYGQAIFAHLAESNIEEASRFLEGGRPSNRQGNPLYLGLPQKFWVKVMSELHYWRFKDLEIGR